MICLLECRLEIDSIKMWHNQAIQLDVIYEGSQFYWQEDHFSVKGSFRIYNVVVYGDFLEKALTFSLRITLAFQLPSNEIITIKTNETLTISSVWNPQPSTSGLVYYVSALQVPVVSIESVSFKRISYNPMLNTDVNLKINAIIKFQLDVSFKLTSIEFLHT